MATLQIQRKFVKPSSVSQYLNCPICLQVFKNAMRLYCGHTFCQQCLNDYMKTGNTCPECRANIDRKNIGMDLLAREMINEFEVFCPAQACPWKGILQELENHVTLQCKFTHIDSGKKKNSKLTWQPALDVKIVDTINEHTVKGSLQARILAKAQSTKEILPIKQELIESKYKPNKNKSKKAKSEVQKLQTQNKRSRDSNFDFLCNLFD